MRRVSLRQAVWLLLVAPMLAGCPEEPVCGPDWAVVESVIDGDTIILADGTRVRYLMVDTPEATTKTECYGPEATEYNTSVVGGREVELRYDAQCRDKYGRLLAYVLVAGREVNAMLIERGYGCVLHIPPNGSESLERYSALQEDAENAGRGLWAACGSCP